MMVVSQLYQFIILAISFFYVLFQKELTKREKIGFSIYVILPAFSIVLQNLMPGYAIAYVTLLLAIEILFLFINVEKNIRLEEGERKLEDANIKIMMSQIRPHFIYNTLSSISTLITIDPDKAQKALDDFTDYLRANFSALTQTSLIPFNDELKHINTYVNLEQMRFNDRLSVVYDIQVADFYIPALSIQPFVENAIKHNRHGKDDDLTIRVTLDGDRILVANNILPREEKATGTGKGLDTLKERYSLLTDKEVSVANNGKTFEVRVPVLYLEDLTDESIDY